MFPMSDCSDRSTVLLTATGCCELAGAPADAQVRAAPDRGIPGTMQLPGISQRQPCRTLVSKLTLRHFFWGGDIALPRLWAFHDLMAAREDVDYHLHVVGPYHGPAADLSARPYVTTRLRRPRLRRPEAWIIRGWNRPQLLWRAASARLLGVATIMWAESPGKTFEARTLGDRLRIAARTLLLPILLRLHARTSTMLGTGELATTNFAALAPGRTIAHFPYPDATADALLELPAATFEAELPRLLFVGSFTRTKAVDLLAAACEELWASGARFEVSYVGSGPEESALAAHVARSEGRARLHGFATGDELADHVRSAHALVLPSRRDGWGLVVHEALAAGVPVICTTACGARALVEESGCGAVIAPGDTDALAAAIRAQLDLTRDERLRLGERGRTVAAGITMSRLADELVEHARQADGALRRRGRAHAL